MLKRLHIQNYALIDALTLTPGAGMNIITGETGAGKSIMLGAIGLILGNRADVAALLDDSRKCIVEAEFDIAKHPELQLLLTTHDLDPAEDSALLIRREITPQGKSRAFVNDTPTTLAVLRELTSRLVDIHSQKDGQHLLDPKEQLSILDAYAGCLAEADAFAERFAEIRRLEKQRDALLAANQKASQEQAYLEFQLQELTAAQLQPSEDEELEAELQTLSHAQELTETLSAALQILEEDENIAVDSLVGQVIKSLDKVSSHMAALGAEAERLREVQATLADCTHNLRAHLELLERDPARMAALEERLSLYNTLKLKYKRSTAADLITLQEEISTQLEGIAGSDADVAKLSSEIAAAYQKLGIIGETLHKARIAGATLLSEAINHQLEAVALSGAAFSIEVSLLATTDSPLHIQDNPIKAQKQGPHDVQFKVRTNIGNPLAALSDVASGGEVSRIMLAIKRALADKLALPLLIFDEIDTGISGEAALRVGKVMSALAEGHQLITITHLPQIAARSGTHYYIYKETTDGHTHTRLKNLAETDRKHEIARILAGDNPSEASLAAAEELLG